MYHEQIGSRIIEFLLRMQFHSSASSYSFNITLNNAISCTRHPLIKTAISFHMHQSILIESSLNHNSTTMIRPVGNFVLQKHHRNFEQLGLCTNTWQIPLLSNWKVHIVKQKILCSACYLQPYSFSSPSCRPKIAPSPGTPTDHMCAAHFIRTVTIHSFWSRIYPFLKHSALSSIQLHHEFSFQCQLWIEVCVTQVNFVFSRFFCL